MTMTELSSRYQPETVESRWYPIWERDGLFGAHPDPSKTPYCIVIPPPNVTGSLHMGHALNGTIQDVLIRWRRMQGYMALWIPGTDHAGIATQMVVEKELRKEDKTRHDLGREKFLERVWKWREDYGRTIVGQLRRMGASCDWTRERFTMDEQASRAVREAFVRWYEKGYIFKGKRIINWCVRCLTALSDLEVERSIAKDGKLFHLRYPREDGQGDVVIATTRPETILADVAVAVNPRDPRYKDVVGKKVILPLVDRKLPVIADEVVEMDFGTGALKITPGHDANDFEVGRRHGLETMLVMSPDGAMNDEAGQYAGLERFDCRRQIVEDLREEGYLVKEEPYEVALGRCYRCDSVLEPYLSDQWFVRMDELAKPTLEVVKDGRVKIHPERYTRLYIEWMENIRDWCISRQLWWGHRIPVWTCQSCGTEKAWREEPTACPKCGSQDLKQDADVLDTWFSSALWPLSTLGWPNETEDLKYFYPTNVLSTDRGILYLWVARMIMTGMDFRQQVPFHDVNIHATVLASDGKKMSKSKGTGIDPMVLFDKYGVDATRFGLMVMTEQGQDIRYSEQRIEMSRNFCNKIWNATRLMLGWLSPEAVPGRLSTEQLRGHRVDAWLLSRLAQVVETCTKALEGFNFDDYSRALYDFFWDDVCDWYLEIVKPVFRDGQPADRTQVQSVLYEVLNTSLRLMHPLMPFITEELWHMLPGTHGSVMTAEWPKPEASRRNAVAEAEMAMIIECVRGIRNLRKELGVKPQQDLEAIGVFPDEKTLKVLQEAAPLLETLARSRPLTLRGGGDKPARALSFRAHGGEVFLPLTGVVDVSAEVERLTKEQQQIQGDLERLAEKLQRPEFVNQAPAAVVDKERTRQRDLQDRQAGVAQRLDLLRGAQ
ncbi:MAG TPA: valine--tRNA ligase [Candidatus Xenobia bacterium]|jgi:valyl-tRNA synthetase